MKDRTPVLSRTADYALRAVLFLASAEEDTVPAKEIAAGLGVPANYLGKTLHALSGAGVVRGVRGPAGGFRLTVSPDALTLARVIEAFDEPLERERCLLGDRPCDPDRPCSVHECWTAIVEVARRPLRETTVQDLLEGRCAVAGMGGHPPAH